MYFYKKILFLLFSFLCYQNIYSLGLKSFFNQQNNLFLENQRKKGATAHLYSRFIEKLESYQKDILGLKQSCPFFFDEDRTPFKHVEENMIKDPSQKKIIDRINEAIFSCVKINLTWLLENMNIDKEDSIKLPSWLSQKNEIILIKTFLSQYIFDLFQKYYPCEYSRNYSSIKWNSSILFFYLTNALWGLQIKKEEDFKKEIKNILKVLTLIENKYRFDDYCLNLFRDMKIPFSVLDAKRLRDQEGRLFYSVINFCNGFSNFIFMDNSEFFKGLIFKKTGRKLLLEFMANLNIQIDSMRNMKELEKFLKKLKRMPHRHIPFGILLEFTSRSTDESRSHFLPIIVTRNSFDSKIQLHAFNSWGTDPFKKLKKKDEDYGMYYCKTRTQLLCASCELSSFLLLSLALKDLQANLFEINTLVCPVGNSFVFPRRWMAAIECFEDFEKFPCESESDFEERQILNSKVAFLDYKGDSHTMPYKMFIRKNPALSPFMKMFLKKKIDSKGSLTEIHFYMRNFPFKNGVAFLLYSLNEAIREKSKEQDEPTIAELFC